MKTIKSGILHLALLVNLMCWLAGVWGCSGKLVASGDERLAHERELRPLKRQLPGDGIPEGHSKKRSDIRGQKLKIHFPLGNVN